MQEGSTSGQAMGSRLRRAQKRMAARTQLLAKRSPVRQPSLKGKPDQEALAAASVVLRPEATAIPSRTTSPGLPPVVPAAAAEDSSEEAASPAAARTPRLPVNGRLPEVRVRVPLAPENGSRDPQTASHNMVSRISGPAREGSKSTGAALGSTLEQPASQEPTGMQANSRPLQGSESELESEMSEGLSDIELAEAAKAVKSPPALRKTSSLLTAAGNMLEKGWNVLLNKTGDKMDLPQGNARSMHICN